MMHIWNKAGINCEFRVSCPSGAFGAGQKVSKLTNFKKKSSLKLQVCKKNKMHGDKEQEASTKIVNFIILRVEVLPPGQGQT